MGQLDDLRAALARSRSERQQGADPLAVFAPRPRRRGPYSPLMDYIESPEAARDFDPIARLEGMSSDDIARMQAEELATGAADRAGRDASVVNGIDLRGAALLGVPSRLVPEDLGEALGPFDQPLALTGAGLRALGDEFRAWAGDNAALDRQNDRERMLRRAFRQVGEDMLGEGDQEGLQAFGDAVRSDPLSALGSLWTGLSPRADRSARVYNDAMARFERDSANNEFARLGDPEVTVRDEGGRSIALIYDDIAPADEPRRSFDERRYRRAADQALAAETLDTASGALLPLEFGPGGIFDDIITGAANAGRSARLARETGLEFTPDEIARLSRGPLDDVLDRPLTREGRNARNYWIGIRQAADRALRGSNLPNVNFPPIPSFSQITGRKNPAPIPSSYPARSAGTARALNDLGWLEQYNYLPPIAPTDSAEAIQNALEAFGPATINVQDAVSGELRRRFGNNRLGAIAGAGIGGGGAGYLGYELLNDEAYASGGEEAAAGSLGALVTGAIMGAAAAVNAARKGRRPMAAIRDPDTGAVFVGANHGDALAEAEDLAARGEIDAAIPARLEAAYAQAGGNGPDVGFVRGGRFLTRDENMADLGGRARLGDARPEVNNVLGDGANRTRPIPEQTEYALKSAERVMDALERLANGGRLPTGYLEQISISTRYEPSSLEQMLWQARQGRFGPDMRRRAEALGAVMGRPNVNQEFIERYIDDATIGSSPTLMSERLNAYRQGLGLAPSTVNTVKVQMSQVRRARREGGSSFSMVDDAEDAPRRLGDSTGASPPRHGFYRRQDRAEDALRNGRTIYQAAALSSMSANEVRALADRLGIAADEGELIRPMMGGDKTARDQVIMALAAHYGVNPISSAGGNRRVVGSNDHIARILRGEDPVPDAVIRDLPEGAVVDGRLAHPYLETTKNTVLGVRARRLGDDAGAIAAIGGAGAGGAALAPADAEADDGDPIPGLPGWAPWAIGGAALGAGALRLRRALRNRAIDEASRDLDVIEQIMAARIRDATTPEDRARATEAFARLEGPLSQRNMDAIERAAENAHIGRVRGSPTPRRLSRLGSVAPRPRGKPVQGTLDDQARLMAGRARRKGVDIERLATEFGVDVVRNRRGRVDANATMANIIRSAIDYGKAGPDAGVLTNRSASRAARLRELGLWGTVGAGAYLAATDSAEAGDGEDAGGIDPLAAIGGGIALAGLLGGPSGKPRRLGDAAESAGRQADDLFPETAPNPANVRRLGDETSFGMTDDVGDGPRGGIRAFHGSPHDFDRFDMSRVGTGEGAQAYGHGLYFAENEGVARSYRDKLARPGSNDMVGNAYDLVRLSGGDENQAIGMLKGSEHFRADNPIGERLRATYDAITSGAYRNWRPSNGRMYEVRINAEPGDFLDWDKPFGQQSERIRGAVVSAMKARRASGLDDLDSLTGGETGAHLRTLYAMPETSRILREAGIPGIRYLDQGSRSAGEGSRNYVLFRDDIIEMLRKYGLIGSLGGLGAAGALSADNEGVY